MLPILVVSQFTLYADTRKGRRHLWSAAAPRDVSEPLIEAFALFVATAVARRSQPASSAPTWTSP